MIAPGRPAAPLPESIKHFVHFLLLEKQIQPGDIAINHLHDAAFLIPFFLWGGLLIGPQC